MCVGPPQAARTAEEIVNCWSESALQNVLKDYGELMAFRTLAADIVAVRQQALFSNDYFKQCLMAWHDAYIAPHLPQSKGLHDSRAAAIRTVVAVVCRWRCYSVRMGCAQQSWQTLCSRRNVDGCCGMCLQAREVEPIRTTRQLLAAIGVAIDKPLRNKGSKKALMFQVRKDPQLAMLKGFLHTLHTHDCTEPDPGIKHAESHSKSHH